MAESKDKVEVRHPANPNRKLEMDAKDFDPAKHEAWTAMDEAEAQKREAMAKNVQEPMPGPPMQLPADAFYPEVLPGQPNAAVIEAPGSKAAEIIQRARGDVPIDMAGTRQDRAEQETRRAESVSGAPLVSPKQSEEDRELRRREYSSDQSVYTPDQERVQEKAEEQAEKEQHRDRVIEQEKNRDKVLEQERASKDKPAPADKK